MTILNSVISAAACTVLSATLAFAQDPIPPGDGEFLKYGEVEGWKVIVDVDRSSCLIEKSDESGVVQMGLTPDQSLGYLGVFSKNASGVKKGSKEEIFVVIDGQVYASEATGMKGNITKGYSGGYILANNPSFIEALAKGHTMVVFPETEATFIVDLAGTYKAMEMGRKCNKEQRG